MQLDICESGLQSLLEIDRIVEASEFHLALAILPSSTFHQLLLLLMFPYPRNFIPESRFKASDLTLL